MANWVYEVPHASCASFLLMTDCPDTPDLLFCIFSRGNVESCEAAGILFHSNDPEGSRSAGPWK